MYESKKNTGRKDIYKYQKSSHQKNFHNSTHFGHHKYNKYKQKYNHSNSIKDYDEERIFSQIFDENKASKKSDLKEIDLTPSPTIKPCRTLKENKENFALNSNINDLSTQMKTNDIIDVNESNKLEINENISSFNDSSSFNNISENFVFYEKENEKKEQINYEINNLNINDIYNENININNLNLNNENININNLNFDVENAINDLFVKNNECDLPSNEKENIHLEYRKNVYKTPQPFKTNSSSSINLSSNDMKEAYYVPKKLSTIYDKYSTQQQTTLFDRRRNSFNNFNFMTIQKPTMSLSNKQIPNHNNLGIFSNINLNYFKNNNNNNNNYLHFNNGNNNISLNNNFNIPNSPNLPIGSFNLFESNNIGNINNLPNFQQCLNHNKNSHHNLNKNPFNNMMPQFELNKCILKTQINNNNLFEKDKENTDILEINVKLSEEKTLIFKIRRYDDMFKTVKMFCEINKLDIKLIRPLIIYIIRALNSIYGIYNLPLKSDEIEFLKEIKKQFFIEEEENNDIEGDGKDVLKNINEKNIINDEDKGSIFSNSKENCNEEEDSSAIEEE